MTNAEVNVRGGVLIGGGSRRMGSPKHLIATDGVTWLERVASALQAHVAEVCVIGEGELPPGCASLPRIGDAPGLNGPIAGILGAFIASPRDAWIIAACDLPQVAPAAIAWLLAQRAPGAIAVLPRSAGGRVEPLLALYEPAARPVLEALPRTPGVGPRALAGRGDVLTPQAPEALAACWTNVNTPAEREALPDVGV